MAGEYQKFLSSVIMTHGLQDIIPGAQPTNMNAVRKLVDMIQDKIIAPMQVLNHMCSGLPGRGTEVAALSKCNNHQSQRDVFILNNESFLFQPTKAKNEKNKSIIRVLHGPLAFLNHCYIAFIHPMAV